MITAKDLRNADMASLKRLGKELEQEYEFNKEETKIPTFSKKRVGRR